MTEERIANNLYAPNQQLVRPDGSGPAEEGEGGSVHGGDDPDPFADMTKDELLEYAHGHGVTPANASMNKADLLAGIKAHQAKT